MKVCRENIMGIFNIPSIITFLLVLYEGENRASQIPKAGKNTPTSRLCIEHWCLNLRFQSFLILFRYDRQACPLSLV